MKAQQAKSPAKSVAPVRAVPTPAVAPRPHTPAPAALQQQALGNQGVQRLLESRAVQAKLTVTPPADALEQEAERVADEVMRGAPVSETAAPSAAGPGGGESGGAVSRAEKATSKDEKKKPDAPKPETKKKDDDKVKREPAKKPDDDKKVKRAPAAEAVEEDDDKVMRAADGAAVPDVSPDLERALNQQAGGGEPLSAELRSFYEPRLGADLSGVRLHTDAQAAAAARDLRAEAFTRGPDVYFAAGKYQPGSDAGRHLIAHELAHTLQQAGGGPVQAKRAAGDRSAAVAPAPAETVQRAPAAAPEAETDDPGKESGTTIAFNTIPIPKTKYPRRADKHSARTFKRDRTYNREVQNPAQRALWMSAEELTKPIHKKLEDTYTKELGSAAPPAGGLYAFQFDPEGTGGQGGAGGGPLYTGSLKDIASELTIPRWSPNNQPNMVYEVDHIVELQLAGFPGVAAGNQLPNMELLEKRKNASSGGTIMHAIRKKITNYLRNKAKGDGDAPAPTGKELAEKVEAVKKGYDLEFTAAVPGDRGQEAGPEDVWKQEEIADAKHLTHVHARNPDSLGTADRVMVMVGTAGTPRPFTAGTVVTPAEENTLAPFRVVGKDIKTNAGTGGTSAAPPGNSLGTLTLEMPPNHKQFKGGAGKPVAINRVGAARYLGSISRAELYAQFVGVTVKQFSPVQIDTVDLAPGKGLLVAGRIQPDLAFLQGTSLDFQLLGDELTLFKTFTAEEITVPRPFSVAACSLTVAISTREALSVTGRVDFGVEKLGSGFLEGRVGTAGGLGLAGEFNFDTKVFEPAKVAVAYADGKWSGAGAVGIKEGKVKGVKSATVAVTYANDTLAASGTAELSVPGVKNAAVAVAYSEADGLTIKGNVNLADGIPGVRGGSAEAEVKRGPDGAWAVKAKGTATPAVPGIDSTLDVDYDDGAFTAQGRAALNRGMLKGELTLGATNRAVGADGIPAGPAAGDRLTAFGAGSATITFTPWLAGTAGVRILPNGELEVTGRIGLPSSVDVFPEKKVQKNVFSIGLDIPIIGVAAAGQRIGVFATVRGGLDAEAGFGPGQLRNLFAEVTYNPDHEDQTRVHGHGEFHVPAHAGLRLFVRGGIGAGIPIVSATANLEVGGQLGIEGAADAMVDVDWSPATGLALDATASLSAQPTFKLDVTGLVLVEADLLVSKITLYEKRWQLAAFEFGSGLTFGLTFPVHYRSGEPFDVKLSDVQFQVPDLDPGAMLRDLFAKIA